MTAPDGLTGYETRMPFVEDIEPVRAEQTALPLALPSSDPDAYTLAL